MTKTILYVGGFELPDKNAAAHRVLTNAKIFRELGYHVVLVGTDKSLSFSQPRPEAPAIVKGFDSWPTPYPKTQRQWVKSLTSNAHVKHLVEETYKGQVHSIICYNLPAIAQYRIASLCKRNGANFIPDATEWYDAEGGSLIFRIIKKLDTSLRMRFVHFRAKNLIATSKYLQKFYERKIDNIVRLPTLYDAEEFGQVPSKKNIHTDPSKNIKFLYAGSINTARVSKDRSNIKDRLDVIIQIFSAVFETQNNFEVNIYGVTKADFLTVFPELSRDLEKLSNHVFFHGRVPFQTIKQETVNADFTIFVRNLSRVILAGFPSKLSESMTFGIPVVSNVFSTFEDYVVEGKNHHALTLNSPAQQTLEMLAILQKSPQEIADMKQYCVRNQVFDYHQFTPAVSEFMDKTDRQ